MDETEFSPSELPFKFEAGILNISGLIGLGRAVKYIEEIGIMNILERARKLSGLIIDGLEQIPGIEVYGAKTLDNQAGIVPFNVKGFSPHDVATSIDKSDNVAIASGAQGSYFGMNQLGVEGIVRASVHYFNLEDEVRKLLRSLKKLKTHR